MDGTEYSSHPAAAAAGCFNDNNRPRRFSDKQIKSLETVFLSDSKLQPRKKVQVARELGLQPRQVAIWFQNKRARWKSKQLEHDYALLQQNYNTLASQYEALNMEKHNLAIQLHKLTDTFNHKTQSDGKQELVVDNTSAEDQPDGGNKQEEEESTFAIRARPMLERLENGINLLSDAEQEEDNNNSSMNADYLELNPERQLVNMMVGEPGDSSMTQPPENWDESGSSYQLWDFWS